MVETQITVPLVNLDYGMRFPPVCVKTGLPAQTVVKLKLRWAPQWVLVFFILGPIPFVIAYYLAGKSRAVEIPATLAVAKRRKTLIRAAWASLLLGFLSMFASAIHDAFGWLILVGIVASIGLGIAASTTWVTVKLQQHELSMRRVSPSFTQAFHAAHAQWWAAQPWAQTYAYSGTPPPSTVRRTPPPPPPSPGPPYQTR